MCEQVKVISHLLTLKIVGSKKYLYFWPTIFLFSFTDIFK
jgi:hypothetical protein